MRSVLVTRPQPAGDELADKLRREGFEVYLAPMTEYVDLPATLPDLNSYQALLFTSSQGVARFAALAHERAPIVFTVGEATAQAAAKAGFQRVYSADGDGQDLTTLVRGKKDALRLKRMLHICGEDTAQDLGAALQADGIFIERLPLYKAKFLDALPPDVARALAEGDISTVTLFSARTAANFSRMMQHEELKGVSEDLEAVCLSDRVAAEIKGLHWRAVRIAHNPHLESVLDILRAKEEGRSGSAPLPADPVIEAFGGLRPLANRLDITASTVQGWKKRGVIPETRVDAIIAAAKDAKIDLDSLWKQGKTGMTDEEKVPSGAPKPGGSGIPPGAGILGIGDRRRASDRRQKRAVVDRRGIVHADAYTGPERRSGLDRRAYEERQRGRIVKEKWRFFNRTVVTSSFFTICILYASAVLLAPEMFEVKENARHLQDVQARLEQIDQRTKNPPPAEPSFGTSLSNKIGEIQETVSAVGTTLEAVKTVAASTVETGPKSVATSQSLTQILTVLKTVTQMNGTPQGRKAVFTAMSKLKAAMAAANGDSASLNAAIDAARKSDPVLEKLFGKVETQDLGAAGLLLALNEYRRDVGSQKPFQDDLAILQKFAGTDPKLQKSIQRLAPYAANGVLSREELQNQFQGLASDIVMAKLQGKDTSVKAAALERLSKLVKVRRIDDVQGQDVDAKVARAQLMLNQGNIQGAITELQTLDGAPAKTAEPFIQQATGTLMADDVASQAAPAVLQQLQDSTGYDLEGLVHSVMDPVTGGGGPIYMSPSVQHPDRGGGGD
jgi:uroporphyrinogen-III synthase